MRGIPGRAPRRYTHDQKVALVTEIQHRHRKTGKALRVIAQELGTTETSYLAWLRAGIEPVPPPERPRRLAYPLAERQHLLAEVDRFLAQGQTVASACRAAGISDESYRRWKLAEQEPAMRPVEITALVPVRSPVVVVPPPTPLTLLAPGGYRLEGLSVESAAALLRALA